MAYICNDCSHQSTKRFPNGKCPACDSYNISSTNKFTITSAQERKPKTLFEIVLLVLLWGVIAYGAWNKYYRHEEPARPKAMPTATATAIKAEDPVLDY